MTVFAIFKAHLDLSVRNSYYHSVVKFDLTIGKEGTSKKSKNFFGPVKEDPSQKHQEFLKNKKNYITLETKISSILYKENKNNDSSPKMSSFYKKLTSKVYDSNLEAKTPTINADFCLHDKGNNVYHHVKIQKTREHETLKKDEKLKNIFLYIIVTDDEKLTEKNKKIFERINYIEENFSTLKDRREKTEDALRNIMTIYNSDEEKQQRFSSSSAKTDSSCLYLCCHIDVDETPNYKQLKNDERRKYKRLN